MSSDYAKDKIIRHLAEQLHAALERINELTPADEIKTGSSVEDIIRDAELKFRDDWN